MATVEGKEVMGVTVAVLLARGIRVFQVTSPARPAFVRVFHGRLVEARCGEREMQQL